MKNVKEEIKIVSLLCFIIVMIAIVAQNKRFQKHKQESIEISHK